MSDLQTSTDYEILNESVTTSYAEITYTKPIRGFRLQVRGNTVIYHKRKSADTNYVTIWPRTNVPYVFYTASVTPSLGFYKTATGTDTLEIIVFY